MRRRLLARIGLILFCLGGRFPVAEAQPPGSSQVDSPSAVVPSTGSTLARLAAWARSIPAPARSLVVVAPAQEVGAERLSDEARARLASEINAVVGAAIPGAPRRHREPLQAEAAGRAARRSGRSLVHLVPYMNGGTVVLEVTVTQFARDFWQRVKEPQGRVIFHGLAEAPADSLLRRFLPPGEGLLVASEQVPSPVISPVALECGDFDGDGGHELLVVGRRQLVLGRFSAGRFRTEVRRAWDDLSAVSPTPLRAPLAAAVLQDEGLMVGSSDREFLVVLDGKLNKTGQAARAYPLPGKRCLLFSSRGLLGREVDCFSSDRSERGSEFDAWSEGAVTEENGTRTQLSAKLPLGTTTLEVEVSRTAEGAWELHLPGAGHALAWDDLDGDGRPELVVSARGDGTTAQSDRLLLFTLKEDRLELVAEIETPPIHALAVCPFSGSHPNLLVGAFGNSLWVFR